MKIGWKTRLCLSLTLCLPTFGSPSRDYFDEQLTIKPLRDGKVASRFSFKTVLQDLPPRNPRTLGVDDISQHYTVFPLALGQILREYAVTELHLTLNAGNWNYDRWGYPDEPGVGTGAELWAWMGDGAQVSIDERWKGLRNALAGLFCASLGSLDELRTTFPTRSFEPEGELPDWGTPHHIRHASLPSEHVCTENLTPFLKLLPCKSLSGIASLLNPHRLFDADWHGMGVHVLWRRDEGVELRLTFQSVFDPFRISLSRKQDWSFQTLFGRTIERPCPVAQSTRVLVTLPTNGFYVIRPEPPLVAEGIARYDTNKDAPLDVSVQWAREFEFRTDTDVPLNSLSVQRTLRGSSQARGQLSVVVKNHDSVPMNVLYLETMPWHAQFFLHTMKIHIDGLATDSAVSNITYIPPVPHSRPATFQCVLALHPKSTLRLTMDVTKSFLRYTEHPPDAQRGWDLPPAVILPLGQDANGSAATGRIYTSALLVDLATPDFSMPYNVIIFTCSLVAFLFGSVFNLLTRKFVIVHIDTTEPVAEKPTDGSSDSCTSISSILDANDERFVS